MNKMDYNYTGWFRDYPDMRDFHWDSHDIFPMVKDRFSVSDPDEYIIGEDIFPPIENQGQIGSCTANAAVGLMEFHQMSVNQSPEFEEMSRLFVYKNTRKLMQAEGDSGAYLRDTMKAMVMFGACSEDYWPYTDRGNEWDKEPEAFHYAMANNYKTVKYYRHDNVSTAHRKNELLIGLKAHIENNVPWMFGFYVFPSIELSNATGEIPFPGNYEQAIGGHAIIGMGYNDRKTIDKIIVKKPF